MYCQDELLKLAQEAGATRASRLPALRSAGPSPQFASETDGAEARAILVKRRIQDKSYKDPNKQKRRHLRSKEKNQALADPATWTFSLSERTATFNEHVRKLGSVGVAQALAEFDQADPLDVNILYPENAGGKQKKGSSTSPLLSYNDLLEYVTERDSVAYITFLASRGAPQVSKDSALAIALTLNLTNATKALLQYDADPNSHPQGFSKAIEDGNLELVELILSAPRALDTSYISSGLPAAVETNNHRILSLLLAYGADGNYQNSQGLCEAVRGRNYLTSAAIITHSLSRITPENLDRAVSEACKIRDNVSRTTFLKLLLCAGASTTTPLLQDELLQAIKRGQLDLVTLLISHGTSPDRCNAEGVRWALKNAKFDMVEVLLQGTVSPNSASQVLYSIPRQISEDKLQKFVVILADQGASADSLGRCLALTIENGFRSAPATLVDRGASLDYDDARSVRFLLKHCDLFSLQNVIRASSSPAVLCKALPDAMAIRSMRKRRQAISLLLSKGIVGGELDVALQQAVGEAAETRDVSLISCLIEHKASANFVDANGNCIHMATKRGDLEILQQLCSTELSVQVVSPAIPLAFACMRTDNYSVVLQMMSLLLQKGARGTPVAKTLIDAVCQDHVLHIVALLLENGADVNHLNGKAVEEALNAQNAAALELLCKRGQIEREPLASLVPEALNPSKYDPVKAQLLVKCSVKYPEILSLALLNEVQVHGSRQEVIELLLQHGARVDFNNSAVLRRAVYSGDLQTTRLLLSPPPGKFALCLAFKVATELQQGPTRYGMMRVLLQLGVPGIGQDEALIEETKATIGNDLSHVQFLIDHTASVDHQGGMAIQEAIRAKHVPLLKLLLTKSPSGSSLANAFLCARQIPCSRNERLTVFALLMQAGLKGCQLNEALIESAEREPDNVEVPRLLLRHGASVDFLNGQAIEIAARSGSQTLLKLLVGSVPQKTSLEAAFLTARQTAFSSRRLRVDVFQCLLEAGVRGVQVDEALIEAAQRDATDLQLALVLLKHQASVNFNNGRCLHLAVKAGSVALLKILMGGRPNKISVELAFRKARRVQLSNQQRIGIYQCLLEEGIRPDEVSAALLEAVPTGSKDLVELLLRHGANVNSADGNCLLMAATQGDTEIFKTLAANGPDMGIIVPSLIRSLNDETHLLQFLQLCFDSTSADVVPLNSSVIFTAMERFPRGARLIRFLVGHGCVASSTREFRLDEGAETEDITALIWALYQPRPGISDSVVLTLLGAEARGVCHRP